MCNLGRTPNAGQYSVYWVDDHYLLAGAKQYRFYEWSSIFKRIWGGEGRIGLDERYAGAGTVSEYQPYFRSKYNLNELDPAGCQAVISIRPGKADVSAKALVIQYFGYRFFKPERMSSFLETVTEVRLQALPSAVAVHCEQP